MSNAPAKRQRRKAMTDAGRSLLNQQRQKLNREQAALGERIVNDARAAQAQQQLIELRYQPEFNAISRGVLRRVAGVLASEGITPAITVSKGEFSASTDFQTITVRYPGVDNDVRLTAAVLRGMLYHEGGHVRWTTPYLNLIQQARNEMALATGSEFAWDRYVVINGDFHKAKFHNAWNALEDQRMETAVVSDSPRKAGYFTPVILTRLAADPVTAAANYPLLIWRRYLPRHVRVAARQAFIAMHDLTGDGDGVALASDFERVITSYVTATTAKDMLDAVIEMKGLLDRHRLAFDVGDAGHGQHRFRYDDGKNVRDIPISPDMLDDDATDGDDGETVFVPADDSNTSDTSGTQGEATVASKNDEGDVPVSAEGDDEGNGAPVPDEGDDVEGQPSDIDGGEADSDKGGDSTAAGSGAGTHGNKDFQDMLDKAIEAAEAERDSDTALDGDVDAFREALGNDSSKLPVYIGGVSADGARAARAESVAQHIEDAFMASVMDRMPAWVEQQRRGILNVGRYATRQAGETEVFRQWADDDQPGYNMAVSILLDYSGSMSASVADLAQAAYASKLACQRLGIPCTVTLWDTKAATLWDANEEAPGLPIINDAGGTNPDMALADLENQRFDKEQHLVMVMTDGSWDGAWSHGKRSMSAYLTPGRRLIGFGYGTSAQALLDKGFQDAYQIRDLMEIPKVLERVLPEMA